MLVAYAFNRKSDPKERGIWGNISEKEFLRDFPRLQSLIKELNDESDWSCQSNNNRNDWTALFFVYYCASEAKVSLELKTPISSLYCPSMPLSVEDPPTLIETMQFVLKNLRRR